jgi:hypothetical protein
MLGFGFQAWLLGLKPMGFGFRPPPVKPLQGAKHLALSVVLNESAVAKLNGGSAPRRAKAATGAVPAGTATKSIG